MVWPSYIAGYIGMYSPQLGRPCPGHLAVYPLLAGSTAMCWLAIRDAGEHAKQEGRSLSGGIISGQSSLAFIGEPRIWQGADPGGLDAIYRLLLTKQYP